MLLVGQAPTESEADLKEVLYPFYGRQAAEYQFFVDPQQQKRLELQKQPVLTWTNAENYMGAVFVWMYAGRRSSLAALVRISSGQVKATSFMNSIRSAFSRSRRPRPVVENSPGRLRSRA